MRISARLNHKRAQKRIASHFDAFLLLLSSVAFAHFFPVYIAPWSHLPSICLCKHGFQKKNKKKTVDLHISTNTEALAGCQARLMTGTGGILMVSAKGWQTRIVREKNEKLRGELVGRQASLWVKIREGGEYDDRWHGEEWTKSDLSERESGEGCVIQSGKNEELQVFTYFFLFEGRKVKRQGLDNVEEKRWSTWCNPQILGVVLVNRRCPVWEALPAVSCTALLYVSAGILALFFFFPSPVR